MAAVMDERLTQRRSRRGNRKGRVPPCPTLEGRPRRCYGVRPWKCRRAVRLCLKGGTQNTKENCHEKNTRWTRSAGQKKDGAGALSRQGLRGRKSGGGGRVQTLEQVLVEGDEMAHPPEWEKTNRKDRDRRSCEKSRRYPGRKKIARACPRYQRPKKAVDGRGGKQVPAGKRWDRPAGRRRAWGARNRALSSGLEAGDRDERASKKPAAKEFRRVGSKNGKQYGTVLSGPLKLTTGGGGIAAGKECARVGGGGGGGGWVIVWRVEKGPGAAERAG